MSDRQPDDAPRGAQPPKEARATGHTPPALGAERGDDPASGTVDRPVAPGEAQAGDLSEMGANLGGPVDVFPLRGRQRKEGPTG
ncbi:hypothetical protein [Roseicella aquatilis]|uniref:Uncharacterized protein n=1 Tax=Roseicella aquatilis TaxID=2527868 RepID=A0A4R4DJP0_9PROT|nr:hypothetical protein [Roseicella aquatilis]TCZ61403.1 hypothetical protein EXY23_12745 [Roseicella aquatilis]